MNENHSAALAVEWFSLIQNEANLGYNGPAFSKSRFIFPKSCLVYVVS